MAGNFPQYILDRGDTAREYRRRSSCISRTSDSSTAQDSSPFSQMYTPEVLATRTREEPGSDLAGYRFADTSSNLPAINETRSEEGIPVGGRPGIGADAIISTVRKGSLGSAGRKRFGVARPTLVHL
ncbi:hypothetical protein IWW55_001416 [Coemansia sp. RSA 2706]|nr:hypothetical protein IWW55_001416 [Coemansia sp. RSA 2706]